MSTATQYDISRDIGYRLRRVPRRSGICIAYSHSNLVSSRTLGSHYYLHTRYTVSHIFSATINETGSLCNSLGNSFFYTAFV